MRKIAVIGTGYVGLVTGVCLSHIGHKVTCIDIDENKISLLQEGHVPIYEPGLSDYLVENIENGRLAFTTDYQTGIHDVDAIFLAVGTPQKEDGSADLTYIQSAIQNIATHLSNDVVIAVKSTVPVGTNEYILNELKHSIKIDLNVQVVSNPEFLREGSAIHDTFRGDRIIIGAEDEQASLLIEEIHLPYGIPIIKTDLRSAEMIKYASNAFLATKISFINEIATICEKLGANIESVSNGMGMDSRIGNQFLQAGIGYGGSCFPKDTKALIQIAGGVQHHFELLESVIHVNNEQQIRLIEKAKERFNNSLWGKKAAILGVAFKPNTDDVREAASLVMIKKLLEEGVEVVAYDPVAINNAKKLLPPNVHYSHSINECLQDADMVFILTEWQAIRELNLNVFSETMKQPIIFDGRNCYSLSDVSLYPVEYYSIGRPTINNLHSLMKH